MSTVWLARTSRMPSRLTTGSGFRIRLALGYRSSTSVPIRDMNFPGVTSDGYSIELHAIDSAGYGNVIQLPYTLPSGAGVP